MAKAYGSRPTSRQSSAAPQGSVMLGRTRSTRSASRELTPSQQSPTAQKKGAKKGAKNGAVPKKRGRKAKATALDTVDENAATIEEQDEDEVAPEILPTDNVGHTRRMSTYSGISGTTAKTSFSQEEIGDLDPDMMVDVLLSLSTASEEMAKLLLPTDPKALPVVRKEIRTENSKYNKLYNNRLASVDLHKFSFGSTQYIQPSIVLRALFGVRNYQDVPQGPWRPDSLIYKINLAQMLRSVLVLLFDNAELNEEGYKAIEALDINFANAIAGQQFRVDAYHLQLSLLTQLAIIRAAVYQTDPRFDPRDTITNTFFTLDAEGDLAFKHRNVLHMMSLSDEEQTECTHAISQLADNIITTLESQPITAGLGALRAQYPWEHFVDQVIQYYEQRKQELDAEIANVGGVDQIIAGLSEEVERQTNARLAQEKRQSYTKPGSTPRKSFGKGGIKALKARERALAASTAPPPALPAFAAPAPVAPMTALPATAPEQREPLVDDGWHRVEDDEPAPRQRHEEKAPSPDVGWQGQDDDEQPPPQQTAAQVTATSTLDVLSGLQDFQRQAAANSKGKARAFIDRQDNAERIAWDDGLGTQTQYDLPYAGSSAQGQGPYYGSPRRSQPKRPYPGEDDEQEDFDPTQDGGFQTDHRDLAAADERRRQLPPQPPPQRQRAPQPRFSSLAPSVPAPSPSPAKRQRKNPGSTIPPAPAPLDPNEDVEIPRDQRMERAKIAARQNTVMASQARPVQIRTPWSPEEENALIDLIEEEGEEQISYSKLKSIDQQQEVPIFLRRSAEDLRFKARNMKVTFLAGRVILPRNFDRIVLDKKAMIKLQALGIVYHQERIRGGLMDQEQEAGTMGEA